MIYTEVMKKVPGLKALLTEVRRRRDDHSSPLPCSQEMLRYDVNRALLDYLLPVSDAVHEFNGAFGSA